MLKVFSLPKAADCQQAKLLFERELKLLLNLDYPSIAKHLDRFMIDTDGECYFYLVRELVAGKCLSELLADSWKLNETELKELIIQLACFIDNRLFGNQTNSY